MHSDIIPRCRPVPDTETRRTREQWAAIDRQRKEEAQDSISDSSSTESGLMTLMIQRRVDLIQEPVHHRFNYL